MTAAQIHMLPTIQLQAIVGGLLRASVAVRTMARRELESRLLASAPNP